MNPAEKQQLLIDLTKAAYRYKKIDGISRVYLQNRNRKPSEEKVSAEGDMRNESKNAPDETSMTSATTRATTEWKTAAEEERIHSPKADLVPILKRKHHES